MKLHTCFYWLVVSTSVWAHESALNEVQNQPCQNGESVDQTLTRKLSTSHRDTGWRESSQDNGHVVERGFLVSKGMELRYRWQVDHQGHAQPVTERAQALCQSNTP